MASFPGSCLCGGVQFEVSDPEAMGMCHCTRCQRWTGGAGSTVLVVARDNFKVSAGRELMKSYQEEGFAERCFCGQCGSALYGAGKDKLYVGAGSVKGHGMTTQFHIQVAHKAPWDKIPEGEVQFQEWPPAM